MAPAATPPRRFPDSVIQEFRSAKIIGVRAGADHRFTGVWVVVVGNRIFVRSWGDKPTGWYRAFLAEPHGAVHLGVQELSVRARHTRSERLRRSVSLAYGEKYNTKASQKWVRGFAEPERSKNTLELVPA